MNKLISDNSQNEKFFSIKAMIHAKKLELSKALDTYIEGLKENGKSHLLNHEYSLILERIGKLNDAIMAAKAASSISNYPRTRKQKKD